MAHPFPYCWDDQSAQGPPGVRPVHLRPALAAAEAATREGHAVPHPEGFDPARESPPPETAPVTLTRRPDTPGPNTPLAQDYSLGDETPW